MLEEKLITLKKELVIYASLVESMVEKSMNGLTRKDSPLLQEVIDKDEPRVNAYEMEIDEICTTLIAQYQPKAKNLRTLLMILRMGNDLERMGDHAVNIVESGLYLVAHDPVKPLIDLPAMGETTIGMLKDGISAFVDENATLAKSVCERDNVVDDFKRKIQADLTRIMQANPASIERALHLLRISGNLERIADLSTNICEDVMFMVEGRVIKHHHEEETPPA